MRGEINGGKTVKRYHKSQLRSSSIFRMVVKNRGANECSAALQWSRLLVPGARRVNVPVLAPSHNLQEQTGVVLLNPVVLWR